MKTKDNILVKPVVYRVDEINGKHYRCREILLISQGQGYGAEKVCKERVMNDQVWRKSIMCVDAKMNGDTANAPRHK